MFKFLNRYKNHSDEDLMELATDGDDKAFSELFDRYVSDLQNFFFRRCGGDNDLAADLTQELFLQVWTKRESFDLKQNLRTWIFTIAYNQLKNLYKHQECVEEYQTSGIIDEAEEDDTPLKIDAELFDKALQKELNKLTEDEQTLFDLRFSEEMTVPEISKIMGVMEGTVKFRLHTLTVKLRNKLKIYE